MRTGLILALIVIVGAVTSGAVGGVTDMDIDPASAPAVVPTPVASGAAPERTVVSVTVTTSSTDLPNKDKDGGVAVNPKGRTFWPAFVSSLLVIILAELGDKTFFIAAIGALRHPRMILFAGAYGALFVMTVLSTVMGYAAGYISHSFTHWLSIGLFLYFGVTLLRNGLSMNAAESADNKNKEMDEVEEELAKAEEGQAGGPNAKDAATANAAAANALEVESAKELERATAHRGGWRTTLRALVSPIFMQFFVLTFVAEWGDRSQIATVTLASTDDPIGVTLGALLGHAICTGLAVIGGKLLASRISERTVTILGGATFLVCAVLTLIEGFRADHAPAAA